MADEYLERIEHWQHGADERFDRIESWQHSADERFDRIDRRFEQVDQRFDELTRYMRLLHEDMIDRLKGSSERDVVTRAALDEAIATEHEKIDRRLGPLELVVRQHSKDIDRLKGRRG